MMTAGAASVVARRAERAAATQRRLDDDRAAAERAAAVQAAQAASTRAAALPRGPQGGLVPAAAQQAKSLIDKKKWRRARPMNDLLPKGAAAIKTFPQREEARFGEEGAEGDALFEEAMRSFKADEFGEAQVQLRVIKQRIGQVGLFGDWLKRHKFGTFVSWEPTGDPGGDYVTVAVKRDGVPKIPSPAALNQYILVQVRLRRECWHGGCV